MYQLTIAPLMVDVDTMTNMDSQRSHSGGPGASSGAGPRADVWDHAANAFEGWCREDPGAVDDLVRTMTPVLWHVVRAYRLDEDAAEDVIQHTWLTLVRKRDTVENPQAIGQWLLITARRQAWRVANRTQRDEPRDEETLAASLAPTDSAEDDLVVDDERRALWRAVQRLPERCQRLLRVIAFDDRPHYQSLATELGLAVGSIGATRRRCLDSLKNVLKESA